MGYHRKRERERQLDRKREGGCIKKPDRCRKCLNYGRKVLPSELTNTIDQFIAYVHRNKAHFTYIYFIPMIIPMYFRLTTLIQKPSLKCNFTYILLLFLYDSADFWSAHGPSCPHRLQTCARLMQGWEASVGCSPPPNQNTGYAGVTGAVGHIVSKGTDVIQAFKCACARICVRALVHVCQCVRVSVYSCTCECVWLRSWECVSMSMRRVYVCVPACACLRMCINACYDSLYRGIYVIANIKVLTIMY